MNEQTIAQILPALFAVLGVLGGAGLTAYINRRNTVDTLASSKQAIHEQWERTHLREHQVWLRDQKQDAYMKFMVNAQAVFASIVKTPGDEIPELDPDELVIDRAGVKVLGSPAVRLAARELDLAVSRVYDAHRYSAAYYREFTPEELADPEQDKAVLTRHHHNRMEALDFYYASRADFSVCLIDFVEVVRKDLGTYTAEDEELNAQNRTRHTVFNDENEDIEVIPDSELA